MIPGGSEGAGCERFGRRRERCHDRDQGRCQQATQGGRPQSASLSQYLFNQRGGPGDPVHLARCISRSDHGDRRDTCGGDVAPNANAQSNTADASRHSNGCRGRNTARTGGGWRPARGATGPTAWRPSGRSWEARAVADQSFFLKRLAGRFTKGTYPWNSCTR